MILIPVISGYMMRHHFPQRRSVWSVLSILFTILSLHACGDTNNVSGPIAPAAPGPLRILTSSPLPAGTTGVSYDITLAQSGGVPPYTWNVVPGSPSLPNGLVLTPSTGRISGTPTTTGTTRPEFTLQDSNGQSVQKVLSMTFNIAPTPLAILTTSLTPGTINRDYAFALSGTGGTTPYTWSLKDRTPSLPRGLTLDTNGVISGTPTETNNATHTFILTDATSLSVEKALPLSIRAIPLSITTTSLPQGTVNQGYSASLAATGGTGVYTWGVTAALPTGLTLNPSTGEISGIPTGTSNSNYSFTVRDQTSPTPQTATRTLQLTIGGASPDLVIATNSPLPAGTITQPYNATLISSGGTGGKTWDLSSGSLPAGLILSPSGVISGTPQASGTFSPTVRVRDSGNPQDTATKQLSLRINLPAAPRITTTSLPAGTVNADYDQTVSVTGGIGTLVWGVTSGALPPGLTLHASSGNISGEPTQTGSFNFTLRVTDQTPQFDEQNLRIAITSPSPPEITGPSSLRAGTVNQPYPDTQLSATGGTPPYFWSVSPALPNGLTLNPSSGVITGTPLSGSNGNSSHEFTVTDSTLPLNQQDKKTLSLTIRANVTPVTITTRSLPDGRRNQLYVGVLESSGGVIPYTWSVTPPLPDGLTLTPATGEIRGTPTTTSNVRHDFTVRDSTNQTSTRELRLRVRNSSSDDDDDD